MDVRNTPLRQATALGAIGGALAGVADAVFAVSVDPIAWGWGTLMVRLGVEAALAAGLGALGGAARLGARLAPPASDAKGARRALDVWSGTFAAVVGLAAASAAPWTVASVGHAGCAALGAAATSLTLVGLTWWAGRRPWGPWLLGSATPAVTLILLIVVRPTAVSAVQASPERPNLLWVTLNGAPASLADSADAGGAWARLSEEGARFSLLVAPSSSAVLAAEVWRTGRAPWASPPDASAPAIAAILAEREVQTAAFSNRAGLLCGERGSEGFRHCDDDTGLWRGWRRGAIGRLLPVLHGDRAAFTDVDAVASLAADHWRAEVGRRFMWVHLEGEQDALSAAVEGLLEAVESQGDRGRTLVVVAGLGGGFERDDLSPAAVDVAGWAWMPGVIPAAAHVWQPVEAADLVATSLAVLGQPGEADATSGLDLRPTLEGRGAARRIARSVAPGAPRSVALREPGAWVQWTPTVGLVARSFPGEPGEEAAWTAGRLLDRQALAIGLDGSGTRDVPAELDAAGTAALAALHVR
jgi:hypothetical protein